jgi:hypothetical protein
MLDRIATTYLYAVATATFAIAAGVLVSLNLV